MQKHFLIISSLAQDRGHLLLDDEYWFKNLFAIDSRTRIITSRQSAAYLTKYAEMVNGATQAWRDIPVLERISPRLQILVRMLQVGKISKKNILLQGFDEVATLPFLVRAKLSQSRIGLVITNNISKERFDRSKRALPALLRLIFRLSDRIFYHSDYELELVHKYVTSDRALLEKCIKIKYHLLGRGHPPLKLQQSTDIIAFYGPVMNAKPWGAIVKLINCDLKTQFLYRFHNVQPNVEIEIRNSLEPHRRVEFVQGYKSRDDYLKSIEIARFVFLPHNKLFAGKLSGILCDAVSCGTPVISDEIEPVAEICRNYGQIGHVFNFNSDSSWPHRLLHQNAINSDAEYINFQQVLKKIRLEHNENALIQDFLRKF